MLKNIFKFWKGFQIYGFYKRLINIFTKFTKLKKYSYCNTTF